jgi:ribose transport system permease protein/putative xylitol transport system permease protein
VARLAGVPVKRVKVATFMLSGLLASVGGLMLVMRASAGTPDMGEPFLLQSIAAVVVGGTSLSGGIGGVQWTLMGALVITTLENGMTLAGVAPEYQIIVRGLVIIVASALTIRRLSDVVK